MRTDIYFFCLLLLLPSTFLYAQKMEDENPATVQKPDLLGYYASNKMVYSNWETALSNADSVYCYVQAPETMHTIQPNIKNMKNLRVFAFGGNVVDVVPSELTKLSKLEELYASENQIRSLPADMGKLKKLRVALLQYNALEEIPESICDCENLTLLDLRKNPLKKLPDCISKMENLRELRIYATLIPAQDIAELKAKMPNTYIMDKWE